MVLFFPSQQNDDHYKFVSGEIFILHQCFLGGTWGFRYCGFSGSFAKPQFFALALGWFLGIISGFYFFLFVNILICTFNERESYIKGQFLSVSFQWMREFQYSVSNLRFDQYLLQFCCHTRANVKQDCWLYTLFVDCVYPSMCFGFRCGNFQIYINP